MKRLPIQNSRSAIATLSEITYKCMTDADETKSINSRNDSYKNAISAINTMVNIDKSQMLKAVHEDSVKTFKQNYKNPWLKDFNNDSILPADK